MTPDQISACGGEGGEGGEVHLGGDVLHALDAGAVQVVVVLARLYEQVGLDVRLVRG